MNKKVILILISMLQVFLILNCGDNGEENIESTDIDTYNYDYKLCDQDGKCSSSEECVEGLCLPRCQKTGKACVKGEVCFEDGSCRLECDENHPCREAYSCIDGVCIEAPCEHLDFWPFQLESKKFPILIHYRDPVEKKIAEESLNLIEYAWEFETNILKFAPPLLDEGKCGTDEKFDVFIWRTYKGCVVDTIAENDKTLWDDVFTYMILDPWGPYGGDFLDATIAHELNHAMQAVYDWNETAIFFEMTSQFIEEKVYDEDNNWKNFLYDYQQNPHLSFDYNDDYETWYMYGSSLYLLYLEKAIFKEDKTFVAKIWENCKNKPGENEPDFEDALDNLLKNKAQISFIDSVIEFSKWRYYTSTRDDGKHFDEGDTFTEDSLVKIEKEVIATPQIIRIEEGPMLLGVQYITLIKPNNLSSPILLEFDGDKKVKWSIQIVPGIDNENDGEILNFDPVSKMAQISFGNLNERTLVILALPLEEYDPDKRSNDRYSYSINITYKE